MVKDLGLQAKELSHGSIVKGRHWKFGVCAGEMATQVAMLKMGQG